MEGKLIGYGRQGLALEVNPWVTKQTIESALVYRGAFVAGWANVETSLIELAIRASLSDHYRSVRDAYPSKLKSRLAYLRKVFDTPGPLASFSSIGKAVLNRFEKYEDFRNMMAHSRMTVMPHWGATFHFFKPKSDKEITYRTLRLTEAQLCWYAHRAAKFSRAVRRLMNRVDQANSLPPLKAGEADETELTMPSRE